MILALLYTMLLSDLGGDWWVSLSVFWGWGTSFKFMIFSYKQVLLLKHTDPQ